MEVVVSQMVESILSKLEELVIEIIQTGEKSEPIIAQIIHLMDVLKPVMDLIGKEFPKYSFVIEIIEKILDEA